MYAFQAGELTAEEHRRLQDHLERCETCARSFEVEESFLKGLKTRLARVPAPPGLETRIRASLRDEAVRPARGSWSWLRSPWFAATAACALTVGLLLVVFPVPPGAGEEVGVGSGVVRISESGMIVDYDCDRAGLPVEAQMDCAHPRHVNALRAGDGSYVQFSLDDAVSRELVVDRSRRGSLVQVEGDYYPRIRTMKVVSVKDIPAPQRTAYPAERSVL